MNLLKINQTMVVKMVVKQYRIVKFNFDNMVHIGELGIGLEESSIYLPADSIFSTIVNALTRLGIDNIEEFCTSVKEGAIKISSAFPFHDKSYFFPKPLVMPKLSDDIIFEGSKKIKDLPYVPKCIFEKWLNQSEISQDDLKNLPNDLGLRKLTFPKVGISRADNAANIYYLGAIAFSSSAGLFFLLDCENQNLYDDYIVSALKFLQDDGIGGKRTWGFGLFEYEQDTITLNVPDNDDWVVTLSPILPSYPKNMKAWHFVKRGGYVYSKNLNIQLKKPKYLLLGEGSIVAKEERGLLLDLREKSKIIKNCVKHPVYVNGKCFPLPVIVNEGKN